MTDTPSKQAIQYACDLANAQEPEIGLVWTPEDINCSTLRALALHLDEVDRVVRAVAELPPTDTWRDTILRALMLPDPVDPLAEALLEAGYTIPPMRADEVRQALAARGYKLVQENPDAK